MRRILVRLAVLALAALAVPNFAEAQKKRGDRFRITAEEIAEAGASVGNAWDVVQTLRPQWLAPIHMTATSSAMVGGPGPGGATEVIVYINEVRQPSLEALRTVRASITTSMRFLDQNRAIQMRGPGHERGVIEVTTSEKK